MSSELRERVQAALERYRVGHPIGEGGMAVVFAAEDPKHNRSVALKVMKPGLDPSRVTERFIREIEIAASLTHPHILPLYDSGSADGLLYLVMPLVEDESLRDRLDREGALPLEEAVRLTREIASALHYAHGRGLVHRDVKPANVLLPSGHAAVTDFGIARSLADGSGTRLTQTGMSIGTVQYMSPEQAAAGLDVDARTDVYALGCVLFEMLEGSAPFAERPPQGVLASKLLGEIPELSPSPTIPETVQAVLEKALAADVDQRYATAEDLARDLELAVSASAIETASVRKRRARYGRLAAWMGGSALAATATLWLIGVLSTPRIQRIAVLPFVNESGDTTRTLFIDGMHDALITEMQQAGIEVIGRRSVMQYRDDVTPVREIAAALDVDAVVEGFALLTGDSVGLRVRVIDGVTEAGILSESFGGDPSRILRVYRDATASIANAIGFSMSPETAERLAIAPPVDPAAYEAFVTGKGHWNRLAPEDLELARQYFERALAIEPDYAQAHAGTALLWGGLQQMGLVSPAEAIPRVRESVARALAADSTVAEAHLAQANLRVWIDWDWAGGEESFLRALALNPSYADAHAYYAHLLMLVGRHEDAIAQARLAVEVEPLTPLIGSLECVVLAKTGRAEEGLARCREVLARDPRQIVALDGVSIALAALGRWDEYVQNEIVRARELGIDWLAEVLQTTHREGSTALTFSVVADSMIAQSNRGEFVAPTAIATHLTDAGRVDEAIAWFELALDQRAPALPYMMDGTWPEALRTHPRFRAIREEMGLPPRAGPA